MTWVLTAAEMRAVDRQTVELGIPDAILMENAGHRVVELIAAKFAPLDRHRIVILCGKGNNGGDGLVVARQLFTRFHPASLDVIVAEQGPANLATLTACGCGVHNQITPEMRPATIVVDALLGTGLSGPPREPYASLINEINHGFPLAKIVAVDIPSGLGSDHPDTPWDHVRAHCTVTFTAPKPAQVLEPGASACGELVVGHIGSPASIVRSQLQVTTLETIRHLFAPRPAAAHKGSFGHVLVVGGTAGKTGAVQMAGMAALRAGAGLVTVASASPSFPAVPELMTEPLPETAAALCALERDKTVVAAGPGLGVSPQRAELLRDWLKSTALPVVLDADALNNLSPADLPRRESIVLTPHPGEMSRLTGIPTAEIQVARIDTARRFATSHGVTLVLKGRNSLVAFPDGEVRINPTGGPAMATGGSGDILTGLIAGLAAQFPNDLRSAVAAAVWLHGRAGDLAAAELGEKCVIATDLLRFLPKATAECANT